MRKVWLGIICLIAACSEPAPSVHKCRTYYQSGELKSEVPCSPGDNIFDGELKIYSKKGEVKEVHYFKGGVEVDTARFYYTTGGSDELRRLLPYQDGVPEGLCVWFTRDGELEKTRVYKEGLAEGEGIHYYPDSSHKALFTYRQGMRDGPFSILRENGRPYITGSFDENLMDGQVSFYDEKGRITDVRNWSQGVNLTFNPKHKRYNLKGEYGRAAGGVRGPGFVITFDINEVKIKHK